MANSADFKKFIEKLFNDEGFSKKIESLPKEERLNFVKEQGFNLSKEDFSDFEAKLNQFASKSQLNVDELDAVVGGSYTASDFKKDAEDVVKGTAIALSDPVDWFGRFFDGDYDGLYDDIQKASWKDTGKRFVDFGKKIAKLF